MVALPNELRPLTQAEMASIHAACQSAYCTRIGSDCVGYHCTYCGEPCSMMGHNCERKRLVLKSWLEDLES